MVKKKIGNLTCIDDDELKNRANKEIEEIKNYLARKNIHVSHAEVVLASITITKRLGAGNWTFACEFRKEVKK